MVLTTKKNKDLRQSVNAEVTKAKRTDEKQNISIVLSPSKASSENCPVRWRLLGLCKSLHQELISKKSALNLPSVSLQNTRGTVNLY